MKIEFPPVYVQAGVHLYPNAAPFVYTLTPPPTAFWEAPFDVVEGNFTVSVTAHGTHLVALHAGEAAPSATWDSLKMRCTIGPGFGIRGVRLRGGVGHPGGPHEDRYVATLGCFKGTAPGPSSTPVYGFITGSMGKHCQQNDCFGRDAILRDPLSPDQSDVGGLLMAQAEWSTSSLSVVVVIPAVTQNQVLASRIAWGDRTVVDLGPGSQWVPFGDRGVGRLVANVVLLPDHVQAIHDGQTEVQVAYWDPQWNYNGLLVGRITVLPGQGDLNGDGRVDQGDLGILLADWGCDRGPGNCPGDIDADGDTDQADLGILLANWTG